MWPFKQKESLAEKLRGHKQIKIQGMRFTIRRLNPLLDFPSDKIPQIFTDFVSVKDKPILDPKKIQEDMYSIIQAGVVEPRLSQEGITPEDLFRDPEIGTGLYREIIEHSLNRFKGLKKLFFSIKARYRFYIAWRKLSGHYQAVLLSKMSKPVS